MPARRLTQAAQPRRVRRPWGGKLAPLPGQARPRNPPAAPGGQSSHTGAGVRHVLAAHVEGGRWHGSSRLEGKAGGRDEPEVAVTFAATAGEHLARAGGQIRLLPSAGASPVTDGRTDGRMDAVARRLAPSRCRGHPRAITGDEAALLCGTVRVQAGSWQGSWCCACSPRPRGFSGVLLLYAPPASQPPAPPGLPSRLAGSAQCWGPAAPQPGVSTAKTAPLPLRPPASGKLERQGLDERVQFSTVKLVGEQRAAPHVLPEASLEGMWATRGGSERLGPAPHARDQSPQQVLPQAMTPVAGKLELCRYSHLRCDGPRHWDANIAPLTVRTSASSVH